MTTRAHANIANTSIDMKNIVNIDDILDSIDYFNDITFMRDLDIYIFKDYKSTCKPIIKHNPIVNNKCIVYQCKRKCKAHGFCKAHLIIYKPNTKCVIDQCCNIISRNNNLLCAKHYTDVRRVRSLMRKELIRAEMHDM